MIHGVVSKAMAASHPDAVMASGGAPSARATQRAEPAQARAAASAIIACSHWAQVPASIGSGANASSCMNAASTNDGSAEYTLWSSVAMRPASSHSRGSSRW